MDFVVPLPIVKVVSLLAKGKLQHILAWYQTLQIRNHRFTPKTHAFVIVPCAHKKAMNGNKIFRIKNFELVNKLETFWNIFLRILPIYLFASNIRFVYKHELVPKRCRFMAIHEKILDQVVFKDMKMCWFLNDKQKQCRLQLKAVLTRIPKSDLLRVTMAVILLYTVMTVVKPTYKQRAFWCCQGYSFYY